MLQPLGREFGWSTDQLSSVFAVRFALFGLLGPFAAVFIARFGLRRVMVAAAAFIATAMVLATRVTELWQLFVLWGLVLGCGTGLTALVLGAMVANRWFTARRGLVVGLLAGSTATGQLLFLPLAAVADRELRLALCGDSGLRRLRRRRAAGAAADARPPEGCRPALVRRARRHAAAGAAGARRAAQLLRPVHGARRGRAHPHLLGRWPAPSSSAA